MSSISSPIGRRARDRRYQLGSEGQLSVGKYSVASFLRGTDAPRRATTCLKLPGRIHFGPRMEKSEKT